jgi:hypothetical protein
MGMKDIYEIINGLQVIIAIFPRYVFALGFAAVDYSGFRTGALLQSAELPGFSYLQLRWPPANLLQATIIGPSRAGYLIPTTVSFLFRDTISICRSLFSFFCHLIFLS